MTYPTYRVMEISRSRTISPASRRELSLLSTEVRVEVMYCGVCGTDLAMREDENFSNGTVLGHEISGRVAEIGNAVTDWSVGDRVAILPYRWCGSCEPCRSGSENHCVSGGHLGSIVGRDREGGYADYVTVDSGALVSIGSMSYRLAALTEPFAAVVHTLTKAQPTPDNRIAVIGCGPLGLLTGLSLRARRANFVMVEWHEPRRVLAHELGLPVVDFDRVGQLAQRSLGCAPDAVIDCAGTPEAIAMATSLVRRRGRVVVNGLAERPWSLDADTVVLREITIAGSPGYTRADFLASAKLLQSGAIPDEVITWVVDLEDAQMVFEELRRPDTRHIKVLLRSGREF